MVALRGAWQVLQLFLSTSQKDTSEIKGRKEDTQLPFEEHEK